MKNFLWVEEYRPHKIEDCILPNSLKKVFTGFIEQGEISNLLLSGPPGVGKTTVAKALCEQLGLSYILLTVVMKVASLIPFAIKSAILLLQNLLLGEVNIRLSSSTRLTIQLTMSSLAFAHLLKSIIVTVALSSPAISSTKLQSPYTLDVPSLTSVLKRRRSRNCKRSFLTV